MTHLIVNEHPIGIFDSGVGGVTVLKALKERLPHESFVYLGDTARLPYGTKSQETISTYLNQNIRFLQSHHVKCVVVACNSASSVLDAIAAPGTPRAKNVLIPVYNVIEPGAKKAVAVSKSGRIGIIGTRATVTGGAYVRAIQKLDPKAICIQQACPLLIPLVEEGWQHEAVTQIVIERYLHPIVNQNIDTLILGCTHFPALRDLIQNVVGKHVTLVDSAESMADALASEIQRGQLVAHKGVARLKLLVTDDSETFRNVATTLLAPIPIDQFEAVHIP